MRLSNYSESCSSCDSSTNLISCIFQITRIALCLLCLTLFALRILNCWWGKVWKRFRKMTFLKFVWLWSISKQTWISWWSTRLTSRNTTWLKLFTTPCWRYHSYICPMSCIGMLNLRTSFSTRGVRLKSVTLGLQEVCRRVVSAT